MTRYGFKCQHCQQLLVDISNIVRRNCACEYFICKRCFYHENHETCKCGVVCRDEKEIKQTLDNRANDALTCFKSSGKGFILGKPNSYEFKYLNDYIKKTDPNLYIADNNTIFEKLGFELFGIDYGVNYKICKLR